MSEVLLIERDGPVTRLTLNRARKLNALNSELVERLSEAVETAATDGTRLLVFAGTGKGFSGGFDFSKIDDQSDADIALRLIRVEALLQSVYHSPLTTLALVHGPCFGAAADLVCACHRRVASTNAVFRMPGLRFGVVLGTRRLSQTIGADGARALLGASKTFNTETALHLGFLTDIAECERWAEIVADETEVATSLAPEVSATFLSRITIDTNDSDMAALVRSVIKPGLKGRVTAYLKEHSRSKNNSLRD